MTDLPTCSASTMVGVSSAKLAHVAHTPTQRGVMALTLSALARKASASAAHWMVFAAISFPSATATRPMYSDPMVMDAVKAAAAGAKTSVTLVPGKNIGPIPLANTAPSNNPTSVPESCGCDDAKLSSIAISFSSVWRAEATSEESFLELLALLLLLLFFVVAVFSEEEEEGSAAMSGVIRPLFISSAPPIAAGLLPVATLPVRVPNKALFRFCHSINRTLLDTGILPVKTLDILIAVFFNTSASVYSSNSISFQSSLVRVCSLSSEALPAVRASDWTPERTAFPRLPIPTSGRRFSLSCSLLLLVFPLIMSPLMYSSVNAISIHVFRRVL
mmetsp:Transcript_4630/g.8021  ORF Transcript_4630/g.8021 Transcript_4630/m.8021 type:complete len:331 (-) Transcript_4630:513-1505(-)